jgi:hypothetical protein
MRWLSKLCYLLALGLFGVAAYLYFVETDDSVVTIDEPERFLTGFTAEQTSDLTFRIDNSTWHAAKVVGLAPC